MCSDELRFTGSSLRKELKWNMEIKTDVDGHVPAPLSSSYKWGNKYSYPEEFKIVKTPAAFQEYESQEKVVPPKPKRRNGINYYEISWKISIYHSSSCAEVTWQHVSLIPSPFVLLMQKGQQLRLQQFASETTAGKHTTDWRVAWMPFVFLYGGKNCCGEWGPITQYSVWHSAWFKWQKP